MFYKFFHCPEGLVMRPTLPKWYLMIINLLNLIKCYINLPNKISYHYSQTILIISLLCDTNIVLNCYLTTFFNESMMKNNKKKWRRNVQFMLLEQILAWWQCSLASREEKFSSIGLYAWCDIGAHPWPSKQSAKLVHLFILFILTLAAAGEIVTTCPMATFRDICTFVRIVDLLLALKCW